MAGDDLPSATDGDLTNGEELKSAQDDDDQVLVINYTFRFRNHQPGYTDGYGEHYAVGLTENATLHRIKIYSEAIGYANCEPDNTAAFGIDRKNNEEGTATDISLLASYKSYNSETDFIDIKYYTEETLAGSRIGGSVHDQIVAAQRNCYDNPSEPGWYRINGTITGSTNGNTDTDYKVRDLSSGSTSVTARRTRRPSPNSARRRASPARGAPARRRRRPRRPAGAARVQPRPRRRPAAARTLPPTQQHRGGRRRVPGRALARSRRWPGHWWPGC
jgi:hypothetical protein